MNLGEPYIDFNTLEVVSSFSHYFKLELPDHTTVEGVMAFDLFHDLFVEEIKNFSLKFEKFFIATASKLLIVTKAENSSKKIQPMDEVY